jgi:hypothetical protein
MCPFLDLDNLTAICEPIVYKNVGASTSHSPMGLHCPLQGYLYLILPNIKKLCISPTQCIYVFYVIIRIKIDYFFKQD